MTKATKKLLGSPKQFRLTGVIAVVAALAVVGAYFILHIHAATCTSPGDANCDGTVNVLDLSVVASNFGKTSGMTWSQGDFNGDGAVSVIDLSILAAHWGTGGTGGGTTKCGLTNVAFCDTFDAPATNPPTNLRSGDLNGVVWGVSRGTPTNLGQNGFGWAGVTMTSPCSTQTVLPPKDVQICNGQLIEAVNDNDGQTVLAMYPRQPFDIAGRTGKVVFDISDDTQGGHAAWPEFAYTDQPVPAPLAGDGSVPAMADDARNGFGISFAQGLGPDGQTVSGPNNPTCVTVDHMWTNTNYVPSQGSVPGEHNDGCVKASTGPGNMNHVEIDMSATSVKVYMTDAGTTGPLKLVEDATPTMPLTRGLVWMEDVHYNGDKFNTQQTHTFAWDNFGFDGPVLPRDLGFDVPDNTAVGDPAQNGNPTVNIGWPAPQTGGYTFSIPSVNSVEKASGALLEFTFYPQGNVNWSVSANGNGAQQMSWPFTTDQPGTGPTFASKTIAIPLTLSQLRDGTNTFTITPSNLGFNSTVPVANIDLILQGAGGVVNP